MIKIKVVCNCLPNWPVQVQSTAIFHFQSNKKKILAKYQRPYQGPLIIPQTTSGTPS